MVVVDTASPDIGSRLRVRLTGMSYERLVNQSRYMDYISSDDYFFLYEGMIESKLNNQSHSDLAEILHLD